MPTIYDIEEHKKRIATLELHILSWARGIHTDQHDIDTDFRECQHDLCVKARMILFIPDVEPQPKPAVMSDEKFRSLWQKVNTQVATSQDIIDYRAELNRRTKAVMTSSETHGKDEREGKNAA